jgi:eukaryotic-like serine/threonine-protein kinase
MATMGDGVLTAGEDPLRAQIRTRLAALGVDAAEAAETAHATIASSAQRAALAVDATVALDDVPIDDATQLPRITLGVAASNPAPSAPPACEPPDLVELATLGEGGMGRVVLARQQSLKREVAVKTLRHGSGKSDAFALCREARITGGLEHPNIVPIHALGADRSGRPVLVMKRIGGVDWATLLRDPTHPVWAARIRDAGGALEANLEILLRVCHALELAHSRDVLHRDVKPDNVMVGRFGEVYLVDWGVAATKAEAAEPGAIVGTPWYMPPELTIGLPADERTDVYLLGATLHYLLTGQPRHGGRTIHEILYSAARSEPVAYDASVPAPLAALCNDATARAPASRPPSVAAFRERLAEFSQHRTSLAILDAALERLADLEGLLAASGGERPADLGTAYRRGTEARFGIAESLRAYPGNTAARSALRRCFTALVDLELRSGHVDRASALLDELGEPAPELAAQVDAARSAASAREREIEGLRALGRDLDPTEHRGGRLVLVAVLTVVTSALSLSAQLWLDLRDRLEGWGLVAALLALFVATIPVVFLLRRSLFATAFNRRISLTVFALGAAMITNRSLGAIQGAPRHVTLSHDLLLGGAVAAALAITMVPRLAACVPIAVATAALLELRPEHDVLVFGVGAFAMILAGAWALLTSRLHVPPP